MLEITRQLACCAGILNRSTVRVAKLPRVMLSNAKKRHPINDVEQYAEQEPYWRGNSFWKAFLADDTFDHAYFVDAFKTICGDCEIRNTILRHFLRLTTMLYNRYKPSDTDQQKLANIAACIKTANYKQRKAYITWEYPSIEDERGYQESHCIIFIYNPIDLEVTVVDSRGPKFAKSYCEQWRQSYVQLRRLFANCTWIDAINDDLQAQNQDDHFCQTWSIILTIAIEGDKYLPTSNNRAGHELQQSSTSNAHKRPRMDNVPSDHSITTTISALTECDYDGDDLVSVGSVIDLTKNDTNDDDSCDHPYFYIPTPPAFAANLMSGFAAILLFWRHLIGVPQFKQMLYYELYRNTHQADGTLIYSRYFTTLEAMVTGSNSVYYPHGVAYKSTGFTFIEDFVDALGVETLQRILA